MTVEPCKNLAFIIVIFTSPFIALEHVHAAHGCFGCQLEERRLEHTPITTPGCPPHDDEEMELSRILAVEDEEKEEKEEKPYKRKKRKCF